MTFSSSSPGRLAKALPIIKHIIEAEGFQLNRTKTRFRGPAQRRTVTGLVLAHDFTGIGRRRLRQLRAQIFCLLVRNADARTPKDIGHTQGWLDYVYGVDERRYSILVRYIKQIENKHPGAGRPLRIHNAHLDFKKPNASQQSVFRASQGPKSR